MSQMIILLYTHDNIQKLVKAETSYVAERTDDFDMYVMDEEYDIQFKRLFEEAHSDVITHIASKYLKDTPTDLEPAYREFPDFSQDRDFILWLDMPDTFTPQYRKSIDTKIQQYIVDYICCRWFETKLPQISASYFRRLAPTIEDVQRMMSRTVVPFRRLPSFP